MSKYTKKICIPQYIPQGLKKKSKAIDKTKYDALIKNIENSNVSDTEKEFLKLAATRHIKFDYSVIAECYCHASKEMQELMEESALVIIDVDDAIANGYVRLSKRIKDIVDIRKDADGEK